MTVESTIKRAEKEVSEGRLWRAKEILGSSISTYGYSREIFRKLAEVLLNMGEIPEAGKYLLLSTDCPTEEELSAIKVFFRRCHHNNYHQLFGKFPSVARLENREEYPEHLRNHLTEIGMPKSIRKKGRGNLDIPATSMDRSFLFGCALLTIFVLTCTLVGFATIIIWIWNALF